MTNQSNIRMFGSNPLLIKSQTSILDNVTSVSFHFKIIYPGYKFSLNTVLQLALQKLLTKLKLLKFYNPVGFESKWSRRFQSIAKSQMDFYFFCDRACSSSYQLLENTHAQIKIPSQKVERATKSTEWKSTFRYTCFREVSFKFATL